MGKIKENNISKSKSEKIIFAIMFVVFAIYTLSIFMILFWAFYNSLKTNAEFFDDMIALPKEWRFSNYAKAFEGIRYKNTTFFGMFFNSVWYAGGMAVLSVLMHCFTGYAFAKYKFFGKQAAFAFVLFTIALPMVGTMPSMYRIVTQLGLINSPFYLVTALGGFGSNFLVMYAFFKGINWAYAEAAFMDGAGHWYVFFKIMLPLAIGPIFALSLMAFISHWNNYETPLIFLDDWPTVASGLYRFSVVMKYSSLESPQTVYFAGVLLSTLPIIAIVAAFGGKITKNVSVGGVKG